LRVPQACKELADVVAREHGHVHGCLGLSAEALLRLLVRCDAIRRPDRFALVLQACEADAKGRLGWQEKNYPQAAHLQRMLQAVLSVDTAAVSDAAMKQGLTGLHIGQQVDAARLQAIKAQLA
jgi:tRNA nucleotidyltransferase (CCA-adding enzyme)